MQNVFQLILYGFQSVMDWCEHIEYMGINLLQVSFFAFFITLIWQLILSPIIGNRSGSLSVNLSEARSRSKTRKESKKK